MSEFPIKGTVELDGQHLPPMCPTCGEPLAVPREILDFFTCVNGHSWRRVDKHSDETGLSPEAQAAWDRGDEIHKQDGEWVPVKGSRG